MMYVRNSYISGVKQHSGVNSDSEFTLKIWANINSLSPMQKIPSRRWVVRYATNV